jgi:hypothetical protein
MTALRECLYSRLLRRMYIENGIQAGNSQHLCNERIRTGKFHFASSTPNNRMDASQFADSVTVDELHLRQIQDELCSSLARENVNRVAQLRMAIGERQSSNCTKHDHGRPCFTYMKLKTHSSHRPRICGESIRSSADRIQLPFISPSA